MCGRASEAGEGEPAVLAFWCMCLACSRLELSFPLRDYVSGSYGDERWPSTKAPASLWVQAWGFWETSRIIFLSMLGQSKIQEDNACVCGCVCASGHTCPVCDQIPSILLETASFIGPEFTG